MNRSGKIPIGTTLVDFVDRTSEPHFERLKMNWECPQIFSHANDHILNKSSPKQKCRPLQKLMNSLKVSYKNCMDP